MEFFFAQNAAKYFTNSEVCFIMIVCHYDTNTN